MRKLHLVLSFVTLLFLCSCGIPSMLVPDSSAVSINRDTNSEGRVGITINDPYISDPGNNASYSPELYLYYCVKKQGDSSEGFSKLFSTFNSTYSNPPYCNSIPSEIEKSGILEEKYNNSSYKLYQFASLPIIDNANIRNSGYDMVFSYDSDKGLVLSLMDEKVSTEPYKTYLLTPSTGDSFNEGSAFMEENGLRYGDVAEVTVYCVLSFAFSDYTNIWNTKISASNYLYSFTIN